MNRNIDSGTGRIRHSGTLIKAYSRVTVAQERSSETMSDEFLAQSPSERERYILFWKLVSESCATFIPSVSGVNDCEDVLRGGSRDRGDRRCWNGRGWSGAWCLRWLLRLNCKRGRGNGNRPAIVAEASHHRASAVDHDFRSAVTFLKTGRWYRLAVKCKHLGTRGDDRLMSKRHPQFARLGCDSRVHR